MGRVLAAGGTAIQRIASPLAAQVLEAFNLAAGELLLRRIEDRPTFAGHSDLADYLHVTMAHRMNETARALHLNARNVLIRDEQISEGTIDQAAFYVREVARRALELGSAALIVVHNHPSGDATPSKSDIKLTRELAAGLRTINVVLHDHIIVGASGQTSFRGTGLL